MSVRKSFGYGSGSPYTSTTFNQNNSLLFGTNGPLKLTSIVQGATTVTVTDVTFVQNGVIVEEIGTVVINTPATLPPPYYLTATIPDTRPIDNIIWGFVKRPQDITSNTVLIAAWDGQEWNPLPLLDVESDLEYRRNSAIAWDNVGLNQGFQFTPNFPAGTYTVYPGVLTDIMGELLAKTQEHTFTEIPPDPDFSRIDVVYYRRQTDNVHRIGQFHLDPGPTYAGPTLQNINESVVAGGAKSNYKLLNLSDNSICVLYLEAGSVTFTKYDSDRNPVPIVAPTIVASNVTSFDTIVTLAGTIFVVTNSANAINGLFLSSAGAIVTPIFPIDAAGPILLGLTVRMDYQGDLYLGYVRQTAATAYSPYLIRLNSVGTSYGPAARLFNSTVLYTTLDFVVDEDIILIFALGDTTNNVIQLAKYNSLGAATAPMITISDKSIMDGVAYTNAAAKNPKVVLSSTNFYYVTFEQETSPGVYAVAFYGKMYEVETTYKASILSDTIGTLNHSTAADWNNNGYILYTTATGTYYYAVSFQTRSPWFADGFQLSTVASVDTDLLYDIRGSLSVAYDNPTLAVSKLTPDVEYDFDDIYQTVLPGDFFIAYIMRPTNEYTTWYSANFVGGGGGGGGGNIPGTDNSILIQKIESLLYCSGSFSFSASLLTWDAPIQVIDVYRGTYTIPAGSVTMVHKDVLYTKIHPIVYLTADGGTDGPNTLTVGVVVGFSIGEQLFVSAQNSSGTYGNIIGILGNVLTLDIPTNSFLVVNGAYCIVSSLTIFIDGQSSGYLRPGSTGFVPPDVYVIAELMGTTLVFRGESLRLPDGNTGSLGDTTTAGVALDGAFTPTDVNFQATTDTTNKLLGQLRLREFPVDFQRMLVTPIKQSLNSGVVLGQTGDNVPLYYDGCQIDITASSTTTSVGKIYSYDKTADSTTDIGPDFTVPILPVGEYLWGAVTLIVGTNDPVRNTNTGAIIVSFGASSNAVLADAPHAIYEDGIPVGEFYIFGTTTGYADITFANIVQIGAGGGGGGGGGGAWKVYPKGSTFITTVGGIIPLERKRMQVWRVQGEVGVGATLLSPTPFGAPSPIPWKDGDAVRLIGMDSTDYPVIEYQDIDQGVVCNGDISLFNERVVELQYNEVTKRWSDPNRNF